jgi:hypothetical protein
MPPPSELVRRPGTLMWRLFDGSHVLEGYVADCGPLGTEFRLYFDGQFSFSGRYATTHDANVELAFHHRKALERGFEQVLPTRGAA